MWHAVVFLDFSRHPFQHFLSYSKCSTLFVLFSLMTENVETGIKNIQQNMSMPHLGYGVCEGATGYISSVFAICFVNFHL